MGIGESNDSISRAIFPFYTDGSYKLERDTIYVEIFGKENDKKATIYSEEIFLNPNGRNGTKIRNGEGVICDLGDFTSASFKRNLDDLLISLNKLNKDTFIDRTKLDD